MRKPVCGPMRKPVRGPMRKPVCGPIGNRFVPGAIKGLVRFSEVGRRPTSLKLTEPFGAGHEPVSDRSTNRFPHRSTNRFPHRSTNRFPHRSTNQFPHRSTNRFPIGPRTIWEGFGAVEVFAKIGGVRGGGGAIIV